jgi:hypothetical protein
VFCCSGFPTNNYYQWRLARGGSGAEPSQKFIKEIRKIYSFKCVNFFIKDWLIYLFYVNNINVSYAKVVDSNLTLSAVSFILFILLFEVSGQLWSSRSRILHQWNPASSCVAMTTSLFWSSRSRILHQWNSASSCVAMTTSLFTRRFVAGKVGAQHS